MELLSNFIFQIFEEKCTTNPLKPNLSFLKQIKFFYKKNLTMIKFRKIYNFEGKNEDDEENINFDLKK